MANTDLTRIPASRVPVTSQGFMTREWYRFFFNLFNITGSGNANSGLTTQDLAPAYTPQKSNARYGTFYNTTTQTASVINTAYPVTLNSTDITNGVYLGATTSQVYVDRPGIYNFQFSLQLNNSAVTVQNVFVWYRLNGTNAANSGTKVALAANNAAVVAAWNFVLSMAAGDYFELVWSTDNTGCTIQTAVASAPVPAIPSVILTVTDNIS
jgi:hypothetical protein